MSFSALRSRLHRLTGKNLLTALLASATICTVSTVPAQAAGPSLETFVMATNGQSNYNTYRQPDAVFFNFGGFGTGIPSNADSDPSLLAGDGIAGTYRVTDSASAGLLTDALSTSGAGRSNFGSWSYTGSTNTTAQYGQLKSESQATHTGNSDNATVNTAESYAIFNETFTPTSAGVANGTSGTMTLAVTVDGSLSITGKGAAGLLLRYGYGTTPPLNNPPKYLLETFADIYGNGYQIYGPHSSYGSFTAPPGMAYTIGPLDTTGSPSSITFGGTSTVFATIPIVFGASANYEMGMMSFTQVGNGSGTLTSLFGHTATITGIQLFDNAGNSVTNFDIASGSGTTYDASGVHLVGAASAPEPSALALLCCALPLTGKILHRRKRALATL